MVNQAKTKIYKTDSRHTLYLQKDLVNDSSFPFKVNEDLIIRIEKDTLIISKT